jgi:cyclopropane fatty-acyl-phospholipid synthase-like methyltransferase
MTTQNGFSQPAGWFPRELAMAGRENLDPAHVARYDGKMDSAAEAEVAVLTRLGLGAGSTVIEFGPGTGQFTIAAAQHCAKVVAVDVSPPMLKHLSEKVRSQGLHNVELVEGGFLSYVHHAEPVDFIYSRLALHHLPDFWKAIALERVRAMLRPGGVFRLWDVIYDFPLAEAANHIEAWCATGGEAVEGAWARAELEEHVRDEHSTFTWLIEPMLAQANFEIIEVTRSPDGFQSAYLLRGI